MRDPFDPRLAQLQIEKGHLRFRINFNYLSIVKGGESVGAQGIRAK